MTEHKVGTREEWLAARNALLEEEQEHARRSEALAERRRELPWVRVEKEYSFETDEGTKSLAELFDGRSQLLAYNIMFGPDYTVGACPGCSNLADHLDAALVHLWHRDVTLLGFSRAPLDKLQAYKQRMGWKFPYVSTYGSDFPFDFGLAFTEKEMAGIDEVQQMIERPPDWLQDWAVQVGADLEHGLAEGPGWIAFALEAVSSTTPTPAWRRTGTSWPPTTTSCSTRRRRAGSTIFGPSATTSTTTPSPRRRLTVHISTCQHRGVR